MTTTGGSSAGLGIVILAVGLLMGGLATVTLRSIWSRSPGPPPPPGPGGGRVGSEPPASPRPLHPLLRAALSIDFGCLAMVAAVLCVLGLVLILRATVG